MVLCILLVLVVGPWVKPSRGLRRQLWVRVWCGHGVWRVGLVEVVLQVVGQCRSVAAEGRPLMGHHFAG